MSNDTLWPLIAAALLHDIGKVLLRTGDSQWLQRSSERCQASPKHKRFSDCRKCREEYGYLHAMLGEIVATDLLPDGLKTAAYLVGAHHRWQGLHKKEVQVLILADWLSANERAEQEEAEGKVRQLASLLPRVAGQDKAPMYFALSPLSADETAVFPKQQPSHDTAQGYQDLWKKLGSALESLRSLYTDDPENYLSALMVALQTYLWSVPSAYYGAAPDISLYEHLRLTAAFSASLWLNGNITDQHLEDALNRHETALQGIKFDLLVGDISGLQRFLYTLTSKAVARGLRGRSFYLDMVTELCGRWLLDQLGLPYCNLLYSGGGRFYLLCYPLDDTRWDQLKRQLAQHFWDTFEGRLYLALARIPFSAHDLLSSTSGYADLWAGRVGPALAEAKARRFSELGYTAFQPSGGGRAEVCAICGREGATTPLPGDEQGRTVCNVCHELAELGRDLAEARYILLTRRNNPARGLWPFLGYTLEAATRLPPYAPDVLYIVGRNPATGLGQLLDKPPTWARWPALAWRFLPRVVPRLHEDADSAQGERPDHVASFLNLADRAKGSKLVGILRIDVDSLGKIFGKGLGSEASPSRLSTLSFLLRLFFEDWIDELCHRMDSHNWHLYLLYSGGDDLFIVGSWHLIPELALKIREDFDRFTGNSDITLSAGIYLADPKLPLYQTAEKAKEALEAAKARTQNGKLVKNAVNFLGKTWDWENFRSVQQEAEMLANWVESKQFPRGFLQKLIHLYHQQEADRRKVRNQRGRPHYGPWVWRAAYYLARAGERHPTVQQRLLQWAEEIKADPQRLESLAYAARWAELLTRH